MFTAPLHYYHYTRGSLRDLLHRSGFSDIHTVYPVGDAGVRQTMRATAQGNQVLGRLCGNRFVDVMAQAFDLVAPRGHLLAIAKR